jgi:copper chaperone
MDELTVHIEGMSCSHCVAAVTKALGAVSGVRVERVAIGSATVAYDPHTATREAIVSAVERAGYRVAS